MKKYRVKKIEINPKTGETKDCICSRVFENFTQALSLKRDFERRSKEQAEYYISEEKESMNAYS